MTSPHLNGRADPDHEAERLSAAWDALVTGRPVETDDEGLVTVAYRMYATTTTARERPGFRDDLRDQVMGSQPISLRQAALSPTPTLHRPTRLPAALDSARRVGVRWLSLAATVALLLVTAAVGYLAGVGLPDGDGRGPTIGAPLGAPSPDGTPTNPTGEEILQGCQVLQPYIPGCLSLPNLVASTGVAGDGAFSAEDLAVSQVQMQRWQIAGGQTAAFSTPADTITGIGMDIVINGAYTARFSGPATLADNQSGIRGLYTYLPANTDVELTAGDVVTYELGTKLEITNPFQTSLLQFKTVLFYDGDPSVIDLEATGEAARMIVDGDGVLPQSVANYAPSGMNVMLTYSQLLDGYPFPPESTSHTVIIGPVDPVNGPVGKEGFILWVSQGQG